MIQEASPEGAPSQRSLSIRRWLPALALGFTALSAPTRAEADWTWPTDQLLPTFPRPATKQELIFLRAPTTATEDELVLFASLKGIVNRTQPRIFSYEGDAFAEGPHTWLESLGLSWTEHEDNWALIAKYKSEIQGLIVFDDALPDTINLATTRAGQERALVVGPSLLARLTEAPYDFPVLEDLRGRFSSKLAVYESLYDDVWPHLTHRVLVGLSPVHHKASLREYAHALEAAVIWLDPEVEGESELLDEFLSSMGPGNVYLGWWPEEGAGIERGSQHGIATVPSDYATNLTLHSGMPRAVRVKPIPPKPMLEDKIYVAFILSDGDNLQYVEHLMRKLWNDPGRGQVPMGWTVSPAMLDAMPGALDFYFTSGSENDNLISGPSGWGYGYPNSWIDQEQLARFIAKTEDYTQRAGLRVVTVWNTITGGIEPDVGASYATHAPSLLGLTAQNTGGGLTIYSDSLPGFALSCNYCTNESAIRDHIASAAAEWDGSEPRFILIQAQPWQDVTPTTFLNVKNSLGSDYAVVRPDHWFQLLRQSNGLSIEPSSPLKDGIYRIMSRASGRCVTAAGATEAGSPVVQRECADDDAQRWIVTRTDSGYVKLTALAGEGQVLQVGGSSGASLGEEQIFLGEDHGADNQQWQPVWEAGEDYHLFARHSERCLDVPGGTSEDVQLEQWVCSGTSAQAFLFLDPTGPLPEEPDPPSGDPDPPTGPGADGDDSSDLDEEGGCACSAAPGQVPGGARWALVALLLFGIQRRRRSTPLLGSTRRLFSRG